MIHYLNSLNTFFATHEDLNKNHIGEMVKIKEYVMEIENWNKQFRKRNKLTDREKVKNKKRRKRA